MFKGHFYFSHFIKKVDIFGEPIPAFNLAGRDVIRTTCGALMSLIIFVITLVYASMKYNIMIERQNPNIIINTGNLDNGTKISTSSEDFMLAFAVESYSTKQVIRD